MTIEKSSYAKDLSVAGASPAYNYHLTDWRKIRDCLRGERRIHEQGEVYLPKLSTRQKQASYDAYRTRARFFNASARTLKGWMGSIFRKSPAVTVPDSVLSILDDIDLAGTTFEEFCLEVTEEVLSVGRAGILVEHQSSPSGRPYLISYKAEEITQWATSMQDGRRVLSLVELQYEAEQPSADEGVEVVLERRCLRLVDGIYSQEVYRTTAQGGKEVLVSDALPLLRGQPMRFIPFVFVGPKGTKPDIEQAPLLDICTTNLHHYRRSADLCHGLHLTALPTPYSINDTSDESEPIELGSGAFQNFRGDNVSVGFLEFSGAGLGAIRQDLQDLISEMAALGAAYVTPPKREAETAEALQLKSAEQNSPLAKIARSVEMALGLALGWLVDWAGADPAGVEVRLNKDFDATRLSPSDLKALSEALQSGAITEEVFAYQLAQAEVLPPDTTAEDFAAQLQTDKVKRQQVAQAIAGAMTPAPASAPA